MLQAGLTSPALLASSATSTTKRRKFISRRSAGVLVRALAALLVARFIIGEGVAWSRAERFRGRISSFQTEDLPSIPPMVNRLRDSGMLGLSAARVSGPLSSRMLELAEPTISDYRNDIPTAKLPQWKAAAQALAIAKDVQPRSARVSARVKYVEGHLLRIEAQGKPSDAARPILERSVAAFREAARLDTGWPDPYIALAGVHAYGLRDVDAVVQDVSEAARHGFSGGRREHAEVADAFSYRADNERIGAARVEGDERARLLQAATTDYQACVNNYAGVTGYFNSDRNSERCRRQLDLVTRELEQLQPPVPAPAP